MRSVSKVFVFGLLTLIGASGCIPSKHHQGANLAKLDEVKIEKGRTTEKELIGWFGQPGSTTTNGDGSRVLSWMEVKGESQANVGLALLSIPGARTLHTKSTSRTLTATVKGGVVTDYTVSDSSQQQSF
jgi:hypothetical protein